MCICTIARAEWISNHSLRITPFESHTSKEHTWTHIESHSQNPPKSHTLTHFDTLRITHFEITQSQSHNASGHSTQDKATGDLRTSQSYRRRPCLRGGERGKYACAFQLYMCIDFQAQHTQGRPSRKLLAVLAGLGSFGQCVTPLRERLFLFHNRTGIAL